MPIEVKYGKIYMKDASGNLIQVMPDAASNIQDYQGATASANGSSGLVPAAQSGEKDLFLKGDGTWDEPPVLLDSINISSDTNLAFDTHATKVLNCTGDITLTLPSPSDKSHWFWIKNNGTETVTLHPASSSIYIDNVSADIEMQPYDFITIAYQSPNHYSIINQTSTITNQQIDNLFANIVEQESDSRDTLRVSRDGYVKLVFYSIIAASGMQAEKEIDFSTYNITIPSNTSYEFQNVASSTFDFYDNNVTGLKMEILCRDSNNVQHYYTCVGDSISGCSNSLYNTWDWTVDYYKTDHEDYWNTVNFDSSEVFRTGDSVDYYFNYESETSAIRSGTLNNNLNLFLTVTRLGYRNYRFVLNWRVS